LIAIIISSCLYRVEKEKEEEIEWSAKLESLIVHDERGSEDGCLRSKCGTH